MSTPVLIIFLFLGLLVALAIWILIYAATKNKNPTVATPPTPTTPPPAPPPVKKTWSTIAGIIGATLAIAVIFYIFIVFINFFEGCGEKSPSQQCEVVEAGKEKTLYRFSDYHDEIVRLHLKSDANFYPKGGKIEITAPSGSKWIDTPGTSIVRPTEEPGEFIFAPADSLAWGVEIWN